MKRELKYIIRRILIGVGIVLVLSSLKSCKVKAWSFTKNYRSVNKSTLLSNSDIVELKTYNYISFYKNNSTNSVYFCASYKTTCYEMYFNTVNFNYNDIGLIIVSPSSSSNSTMYRSCAYMSVGTLPKLNNNGPYDSWNNAQYYSNTYGLCVSSRNSDSYFSIAAYINANNETSESFMGSNINLSTSTAVSVSSTTNWNWRNSVVVPDEDIIGSNPPEFVSWHATKRSSNNVLLGYIFRPEFSTFDTDNYIYEYKFNNSPWLILTENEQVININANGTIYVQIKDKNTSEVIDSATFTATKIGTFITEQTYDINFSGEYKTENYLSDNVSSKSQSIIQEYQIYIDYLPKSSILKYQYQYVKNGDSLNNDNWNSLSSSDNGTFTYVTSENGTLYARILDSSDSTLYTATFTVNSIGLLAFDSNDKGINNFFTKLSNKISYGGPISNLFRIPVDILDRIYSYSSDTCSPYKISNLLGTDIVLPCYDFRDTFGDSIYTLFDSLLCFVLSLTLFKTVRKMYDKFINMEDISS